MSGSVGHYRPKRPAVVEAIQYWPHDNCKEIEAFLGEAEGDCADHAVDMVWQIPGTGLDPWVEAHPGDWIIRAADGQYSVCPPDVFAEMYEPAVDETTPT